MINSYSSTLFQFVKLIFFLFFSFYTALLFSPLIEIPFDNPYNIVGPTLSEQFNPGNNSLRYTFIIVVTLLTFYLLQLFDRYQRKISLRILFIFIISLSFFFYQTTFYNARVGNIDMFHDGEQLGVGSGMYHFQKKPFTELFFLHGAFTDPLVAYYSFQLFGPSIGSFYFLNSLLIIISFITFIIILSIIIKDTYLFFLAAIYLYGASLSYALPRDLLSILFVLLIFLIVAKKVPSTIGVFLSSFIAFFCFYITLDRGYYLFATNIFFVTLYGFSGWFYSRRNFSDYTSLIFFILVSLLGTVTAISLGVFYFGFEGFNDFFVTTFIELPKIKPFLDEYIFPNFSIAALNPFWWPIIFIILNFLLIFHYFFLSYKRVLTWRLFLLPLSLLAFFYYRSVLGRSDLGHVLYVSFMIFLTTIIIFDFFIALYQTTTTRILIYLTAFFILLLPYFDFKKALLPPPFKSVDLVSFITLPQSDDLRWLSFENQQVSDYVVKNTTETDYLFVFTNESAYYYLTKRQSPTRFYTVWFASPNFYQDQVIQDLKTKPPKYILYHSNFWSNAMDGIVNEKRLKKIDDFIKKNYQFDTQIESMIVFKKR